MSSKETFLDALERLKKSAEFKKLKGHEILIHGFIMVSDEKQSEWQIGYYNKENDKISTFIVGEKITKNPEAEMLKQEKVNPLVLENITVDHLTALERAQACQRENYGSHEPLKIIVLIQNIAAGQVWNITYLTKTFKTINFKIDAKSGKLLNHEMVELFKFT